MEVTILNAHVSNTAAIEQIVNATVALAVEQGITPETEVDVDHPLRLGHFEGADLSSAVEPKADVKVQIKPDEPKF